MEERVIFHIDVNSAYLSWTAVRMLQLGETTEDIREIPSIVGGNTDERHGIVLAKSILAKRYNIKTGEPVVDALKKCPNLKIFKPNYRLFMDCSNAMYNLLYEYSPKIQRYSVDEVFIDMSHFKENYMEKAIEIQNRIRSELGFNVNIGISTNKLLAKMASDLEPKNAIHTLFKEEIQNKMWTLPVDNLFMVGRATKSKLDKLNINTIGELANFDIGILESIFKSHGKVIYNYANGIEESSVRKYNYINVKGIGNSTTIAWDVTSKEEALKIILSLTESVCIRLRNNKSLCKVISISIKGFNFERYIHQRTLSNYTDCTEEIYKEIVKAFNESWRGEPIRQLGVRVTNLCSNEFFQSSLFDSKKLEKQRALDKTIDSIRERYGNYSVIRSTFLHSGIKAINGGNGEDNYPMMGSIL
ncbi:DNA polymerase IV [Clostridium tertium]|uniref:Y-family DNA polymerase n=1 Tax=Clostridium TaxID=1485 RepID=UPI00115A3CA0|nr:MULTISPECIES: DNA polymerase IV [Clostridium]MBS5305388.1 DNA polymerase IV [Clostridium sp.]MDB1923428.1 DNA polymerase IV [Clostridium tertium]MDB1927860.1 DNA polymerase IV [Clostridium tertium]MDB1931484.1 DNA polymerase IV [Clostridium tertium]MDB1942607.1 DNA polymerase IV [Clostridium tertium]